MNIMARGLAHDIVSFVSMSVFVAAVALWLTAL
jgi:hypothetical protein